MKKFKIGFAGFRHGHIFGLYNLAKNNDEVEIVAAWEENEDAKKQAEASGVIFNCNSFEDLINNPEIDIIAIGDYYGRRGELAIKSLKSGKHIIADKPLCTSLNELEEIKRLSIENNLKVGLMLDLRYHKNFVTASRLLSEGHIGEINNICFEGQHKLSYGERPMWYFEEGKHGGTINDIAIHGIDIVKYYCGLDIEKINAARCWNKFADKQPKFKESAQFMLTLTGGAGLIADVSYAQPSNIKFPFPYYWGFKIWGTKGVLAFTVSSPYVELYKNGENELLTFEGEATSRNCLVDLLKDIKGEASYTEGILSSVCDTLTIQAFADNN